MSGHDDEISAFAKQWHHAFDHLLANRRAPRIKRALREALALFHGNKLAAVLKTVEALALSRSTVLAFCDLPVDALTIPDALKDGLRGLGIRYGGELFRFDWEKLSSGQNDAERVRVLLLAIGFPSGFDPWAFGWRPAYLADPAVRAALDASWAVFHRDDPWDPDPLWGSERGGFRNRHHFVGAALRALDLRTEHAMTTAKEMQAKIGLVPELAPLHAAMFLPEDWSPPAATCPEWDAYASLVARAREFARAQGRPNGLCEDRDAWASAGTSARRAALSSALRAEGMSPCFFDLAVFEVGLSGEHGHRFSRDAGRCGTKTVRSFLALTRQDVKQQTVYWIDVETCLAFWGLKLGMTDAELDQVFGSDTIAAGA